MGKSWLKGNPAGEWTRSDLIPNSCAFGSIIKDGDVAGSNGPKGDCAATSCTICPNGDTNGIGESNTNANTITAYM